MSADREEHSGDDLSEASSKIHIELDESDKKAMEEEDPFEDLKSKYKEFFITYSDDNVKEFNGDEMT